MSSTLLDAFDRPATVRVHNLTLRVGALTLGDLADLQAWLRDNSWNPWEVPDPGRPDLALAMVVVNAEAWPPPIGSSVADMATDSDAYAAEFAYVAFGRSNGLDREQSAMVGAAARAQVVPWQEIVCAVYGERPESAARRMWNALDGVVPPPDTEGADWALSIAALVIGNEDRRGLSFAEAEALTLPQYRLLCRAHRDAKGRLILSAANGVADRARPGEHWKDAKTRRAALLAEATALLDVHYSGSGTGSPPGGEAEVQSDRPIGDESGVNGHA